MKDLPSTAAQWEQLYSALQQENARLQSELIRKEGIEEQLRQALAELAQLRRQLFGERSDRLTPEEESQMAEVAAALQEEAQGEPPLSDGILADEQEEPMQSRGNPPRRRRHRHPLPEHLERQTQVLEPEGLASCIHCQRPLECIGEEVTEELDYVPARLVVRRLVRRKYACRCGNGGVHIAPLPPRLLPQSKLGVALAVYLLLARFDDPVHP